MLMRASFQDYFAVSIAIAKLYDSVTVLRSRGRTILLISKCTYACGVAITSCCDVVVKEERGEVLRNWEHPKGTLLTVLSFEF